MHKLSTLDLTLLAPFTKKLTQRSPLDSSNTDLILALPRRVTSFESSTQPVRQGDTTKTCCLVLSGFVCRTKFTGSGLRQILSIHLKGDLVDIQNVFLTEADYNVQTLTNATLAFIPKHEIVDLIDKSPEIRKAIWLDILADASISREWLLNVGQRNARARVSHLICEIVFRQNAAGFCRGMTFEWPMTQEQFGDSTGLTAVHVNRMLKLLRNDGIITYAKSKITILDWNRLKSAASFSQEYLHYPRFSLSA